MIIFVIYYCDGWSAKVNGINVQMPQKIIIANIDAREVRQAATDYLFIIINIFVIYCNIYLLEIKISYYLVPSKN